MNDFGGAEAVYKAVIERQPEKGAARMELAQLIWMRAGDGAATLTVFDPSAGMPAPVETYIAYLKAQALELMIAPAEALALMRTLVTRQGLSPALRVPMLAHAAHLAGEARDGQGALSFAAEAVQLAPPGEPGALEAEVRALLAVGAYEKASGSAARLLAANPQNRHYIALQAAAWRLTGDPRYGSLSMTTSAS